VSWDRCATKGNSPHGPLFHVQATQTLMQVVLPHCALFLLLASTPFTRRSAALHSAAALHLSLRHSSLAPFIPPHGQLPLVEHPQNYRSSSSSLSNWAVISYPGSSPRRAAVAIREATNPGRGTATRNHLLVEQNSYRSPSHFVTYIRHPSSYYSANCA